MQAFPGTEDDPVVAPTKEAKFGDYQCNNAMKLFNQLKGKVSSCPSHLHAYNKCTCLLIAVCATLLAAMLAKAEGGPRKGIAEALNSIS